MYFVLIVYKVLINLLGWQGSEVDQNGGGQSPGGIYRVGGVDDDRRWAQDGKDRVGGLGGD